MIALKLLYLTNADATFETAEALLSFSDGNTLIERSRISLHSELEGEPVVNLRIILCELSMNQQKLHAGSNIL